MQVHIITYHSINTTRGNHFVLNTHIETYTEKYDWNVYAFENVYFDYGIKEKHLMFFYRNVMTRSIVAQSYLINEKNFEFVPEYDVMIFLIIKLLQR